MAQFSFYKMRWQIFLANLLEWVIFCAFRMKHLCIMDIGNVILAIRNNYDKGWWNVLKNNRRNKKKEVKTDNILLQQIKINTTISVKRTQLFH